MRLSGDRYDEIEKIVIKMFNKLHITSFPIDCFEICKQLGYDLCPYSDLSSKKRVALKHCSEDGCNILWDRSEGESVYVIYYNDRMPAQRIRFTIMHEIAHITLEHTEDSDLAESEANYFAKYALAPPPLVHKLEIEDYLELAERFDLSNECAFYSMEKYTKWRMYGPPELQEHETTLIKLFQPVLSA